MAQITLNYTLHIKVDPDGHDASCWARIRLAASILVGRPVLLTWGPTAPIDDTAYYVGFDTGAVTDTSRPPRPNLRIRADWAMPPRPVDAPIDSRPCAHLVGASDGWALYWATDQQVEDGDQWSPDVIPWPFDNDDIADSADMAAAGFLVIE